MSKKHHQDYHYIPIVGVCLGRTDKVLLFAIEGDDEKPDGRWIPWSVIEESADDVDSETIEISVRAWWLTKYDLPVI